MIQLADLERIYRTARLLLDCTCLQLESTPAGCPDRRCVVPDLAPSVENCCASPPGGQLTVNVERTYPTTAFPASDSGIHNNCDAPYLAVVYSVDLWRCMPVGHGERPPDCEDLDAAGYTAMVDLFAVSYGVSCCLRDADSASAVIGTGFRWSLGDHVTTEASGGCVGTSLTVVVGIPRCWEC